MISKLTIGIVGAGAIAKDHARSLVRNRRVQRVTFFDADTGRARAAAIEFNGDTAGSARELVQTCDVVWICTPPFGRRDAIREACAARVPIFCEKPLALDARGLRWVTDAVRRARVPFFMGQSGRYSAFFVKMKELVASGAVGQPTHVWSTRLGYMDPKQLPAWRFDDKLCGGAIMEVGIHEVDFIRWVGGEWTTVSAVAPRPVLRPKFQDTVSAVATLRKGVTARLNLSIANPRYLWQRGVDGKEGSLFFDDARVREVQLLRPRRKPKIFRTADWQDKRTGENLSFKDQAAAVLGAVVAGRKPEVTLADGAAAVRAALAVRASVARGRTVQL